MKKQNKFRSTLESDAVSGDIFLVIPEKILNELEWYEDTELVLEIEAGELLVKEYKDE